MNGKAPIPKRSALPTKLRDKLRQDGRALCHFAAEQCAGFNEEKLLAKFQDTWRAYAKEWSNSPFNYGCFATASLTAR